MVESTISLDDLNYLQERFGRGERAEREMRLGSGLSTKVTLDTPKSVVIVESGGNFRVQSSSILARKVNDANLADSAGGYIYKDGTLIYRTSSLYSKSEFPAKIISQMLQIHCDAGIRCKLEDIVRECQGSR